MTEKEKAKQITAIFREIYNKDDTPDGIAKACAIYAIDLMLTEFKDIEFNYGHQLIDDLDYWGKVKQELENM